MAFRPVGRNRIVNSDRNFDFLYNKERTPSSLPQRLVYSNKCRRERLRPRISVLRVDPSNFINASALIVPRPSDPLQNIFSTGSTPTFFRVGDLLCCVKSSPYLFFKVTRCREYLSSGENRAGCADLVTSLPTTFFSV